MAMDLFSDSLLPILLLISVVGWYEQVLLLAQPLQAERAARTKRMRSAMTGH